MSGFVSVAHIRTWPYKNSRFNKAQQYILERFFNVDSFFNRDWDIYHYETSTKDFFLLTIPQVQAYLNHIHLETGLTRNIQEVPIKQLKFALDFNDDEPISCGISHCMAEFDALVEEYGWKKEDNPTKTKESKAKKAKKAFEKRRLRVMHWRSQVRCGRQILGLGNHAQPAHEKEGEVIDRREMPVLVAIDVEAWERDNNKITEIGISTLDTAKIPAKEELDLLESMSALDMSSFPDPTKMPRTKADAIVELIKYRHLLIYEHRHLRNGQFVSDAADKFDFGASEWVSLADVPRILGECLRFYDADGNKRKIMIVGHDTNQDLQYLRITGYDVWNIKDLEVLDTASLHKAVMHDPESRSLAKVLNDVNVLYWNLHNAGNDAAYTLQAFVRLADRGVPPTPRPVEESTEEEEEEDEVKVTEPAIYDYEELVQGKCIKYTEDHLGPRPQKSKKSKEKAKKAELAAEVEVKELLTTWKVEEVPVVWDHEEITEKW